MNKVFVFCCRFPVCIIYDTNLPISNKSNINCYEQLSFFTFFPHSDKTNSRFIFFIILISLSGYSYREFSELFRLACHVCES